MIRHAAFAFIAAFWVVMNALLWHSEFRAGNDVASSLPAAVVWEKVFTAPDPSNLSLIYNRRKLGYIHWRPATGEEPPGLVTSENEPEGMVGKITEYRLELDGSLVATNLGRSIRFNGELALSRNLSWKRFRLQSFIKPAIWEIKANARSQELWIQAREGDEEWIQRFEFRELADPSFLISQLESPLLAGLLRQYLPTGRSASAQPAALGLDWHARQDWLKVGRERLRIYRLEARIFDRFQLVLLVSRVGEILKVELPGELALVNDVLFPAL